MSAINRLYAINNKTVKKTVNIEDKLYNQLMKFTRRIMMLHLVKLLMYV